MPPGELLVSLLIAALLCLLLARRRSRRPTSTAPRPAIGPDMAPADAADIDERLRRAAAESCAVRNLLVESHVRPLLFRQVPLHLVEAVPELHTVLLRFADGTAFVARGETAGDAGVLAASLGDRSVCGARFHSDELGTHLVFGPVRGGREVSMILTGLEQAV